MADAGPWSPDEERRLQRGLKFRKRDDHAVELFREAQANLADPSRVRRILVELGRFYNPYTDRPIVDVETARRVMEHLEAGEAEAAGRLLDQRLTLYAGTEPEAPPGR